MSLMNALEESIGPVLQAPILIVDDQPANIALLRKMLETEGYRNICSTTDPTGVPEMCRKASFDLILLDICMPELDGFEVMELLKKDAGGDYLPILVLTALADNQTRIRALQSGAKDFVTKPFNRHEILNRVRNILEVRQLHNQLLEQNAGLERQVRERTAELSETRLEIIQRLGYAAEHRDNETGLHIIRMSHFSALLARTAGLSGQEEEMILNASPMHDIGKLAIPDRILLKPGKLDREEWEIMKTHAKKGAEILEGHPSGLLKAAREIALCHHEKWDGSGYPNGLKEEEISIEVRIVAIADVFDALTSKRPYKESWPVEKAFAEIETCAGRHFDPKLAETFLTVKPEIQAIMERYAEPS